MQDTELNLQLREQQLKTISYTYRLLYQNFRITTNEKCAIDTQTNKKNQLKYNPENNHQNRRGENKRGLSSSPPLLFWFDDSL